MILKILSVIEDASVVFAVLFFFSAIVLRCIGEPNGWAWGAFWAFVGVAVLASGAILRIGPGSIAKIVKARAEAIARGKQ